MQEIEYFYSAHSAFAYLGSSRFMQIAASGHCRIRHRPIFLNPVIAAAGGLEFQQRSKAHVDYYFRREIERWSELREAPVVCGIPTHHRKDMTMANCLLIAADLQHHNIDQLAHALLEAHWRDDADLADPATLEQLCQSVELEPQHLLQAAATTQIREQYEINTAEAMRRSVFGSPTYFLGKEMFYGQDHLHMLERALLQPFPGQAEIAH